MAFATLHQQHNPLRIASVRDAVLLRYNRLALATSGAAMAAMSGDEEAEMRPVDELPYMVRRIKSAGDLPLTVAPESASGETVNEIAINIKHIARPAGAGINAEHGKVVNASRLTGDGVIFAGKLKEPGKISVAEDFRLFMNIPASTFFLNPESTLQETLYRGHLYQQSADGEYVVLYRSVLP